jgi:hypothetical protein
VDSSAFPSIIGFGCASAAAGGDPESRPFWQQHSLYRGQSGGDQCTALDDHQSPESQRFFLVVTGANGN